LLTPSTGIIVEGARSEATANGRRNVTIPFTVDDNADNQSVVASFTDECGAEGTCSLAFAFDHNSAPDLEFIDHITVGDNVCTTIGDSLSEDVKTYLDTKRYICFTADNNGSGNNLDVLITPFGDGDVDFFQSINYYSTLANAWQDYQEDKYLEGPSITSGVISFIQTHDWNGDAEIRIIVTDHVSGQETVIIKQFTITPASSTPKVI